MGGIFGGGNSGAKALARQQAAALAAQRAQQAIANENVATEQATVNTGGTAEAAAALGNNLIGKGKKRSLATSLGLNI